MGEDPLPRVHDGFVDGSHRWFPAIFSQDLRCVRDERRGLSFTASATHDRDRDPGDSLAGASDFENGMSDSSANIQSKRIAWPKSVKHGEVRPTEVSDVDIVSNTSAISCRIIVPHDDEWFASPQASEEACWNEARVAPMILADATTWVTSDDIETSQCDECEFISSDLPGAMVFDDCQFCGRLGCSIWIDGSLRTFFRDGDRGRGRYSVRRTA